MREILENIVWLLHNGKRDLDSINLYMELQLKEFSSETELDVIKLVNAYTAKWPYSRPIDLTLIAHWKGLGKSFQPSHIVVA